MIDQDDERLDEPRHDPIVAQARAAGDAYMRQFNYDLKAAFADLRQRTEASRQAGRTVVSLPPRRVPTATSPSTKKAG
jgi:transaldolase